MLLGDYLLAWDGGVISISKENKYGYMKAMIDK